MVIVNTKYMHKISRRVTWVAPDGITKNQIDYILVEKKCSSSINGHKTRSFPGADVGSDHNLAMTTMKLKLKKIQRPPSSRIKYNTSRLKNAETLETCKIKIGGKFAPLLEMTEIQEVTDLFTEGMKLLWKTAYKVIKELTNERAARVIVIEDADGKLLTEAIKIQKRWTEYIQELHNYPISTDSNILHVLEQEGLGKGEYEPDILKTEIEEAGDLKKCTNYRTISLISHPSKVLLKVISNRLKTKAENILAEEQAGFRSGRSTSEQIANVRILGEKDRDHQMEIHHNFIDFKKAGTLEWFQTTVGVRQGCILSPCLFNIFLEQIMADTLENYSGTKYLENRLQTLDLRMILTSLPDLKRN
ncbi:uncharacterized protein [Penaeus vannamei]|uniref:uncharacterized protein n=1 Tax=Penaeus vannamei TaxID=6689 RepID=UPI00387F92AB